MTRPDIRIPVDDDGPESYGDALEREAAEEFLSGRMTLPADFNPADVDPRLVAEVNAAPTSEPDEDPLVATSVRLRRSTIEALQRYADARGTKPGTLLRQWAEEGFAAATGVPADPIAALRRATEHVVQAYQQKPAA